MKVIFENEKINIISENELIVENNKVIVTGKKNKSNIEIKTNSLTIVLETSVDVNEEYSNLHSLNYTLILNDDIQVKNVSLIKEKNTNINKKVVINENDRYEQIVIDLFDNDYQFDENIDIDGVNSYCYSKVASMVSKNKKKIRIAVNHLKIGSSSKLDNYGVVTSKGNLEFEIIGNILKKCKKSNVLQNNKIILFDKDSTGEIKPLLYIDENDVVATHAAAVGKVDDNHIFYLMSRGINEIEAKKTIALGYLKPVLEYINDEKIKNEISNLMEKEVF